MSKDTATSLKGIVLLVAILFLSAAQAYDIVIKGKVNITNIIGTSVVLILILGLMIRFFYLRLKRR
ncbi:MAG: hypothetical protein K6G47_05215 [Clostridia bacterium]|nr:hypothetical protein [Clostridia bacterium]